MQCDKHDWYFHAQLNDGTIVRWCGECGGLQTYTSSHKSNLGLDKVGLMDVEFVDPAVQLPQIVKHDDGLYSEGIVRDNQPYLHRGMSRIRRSFMKPWTPDDDGSLIEDEPVKCSLPPEMTEELAEELAIIAGINKPSKQTYKEK